MRAEESRVRIVVACLLAVGVGCGETVDPGRARRAVEDAGYADAAIMARHGIAPELYGCSKDDAVAFDVAATNSRKARVDLTVCCGLWLKGCTIRH